ncbi:hypothetical protein [Hymenobacter algoricola]|uniref:Gliding motility-associated protein GldM first immunoglobulin-like domain-containing protein n=1 Tax=Hymenobacter algoricola TaxID=486267 RepID=A0ABP7NJ59_9BACT
MRISLGCLFLLGSLASCHSGPDPRALRLRLLADTQQRANDRLLREAGGLVRAIEAEAAKNRNQARDLEVLAQARAIMARTQAVSAQVRAMRTALLDQANVEAEPGKLADQGAVRDVIMAGTGASSADSLYRHLGRFIDYTQPFAADFSDPLGWLPPTVREPGTTRLLPASRVAYREFLFAEATVAEALAALAQQEAGAVRLGVEALLNQRQKVGAIVDNYYRLQALAVPASSVVRAGSLYSADLLLVSGYSKQQGLWMQVNGDTIPVGSDGQGKVRFPVASQLPPGQDSLAAFWNGKVTVQITEDYYQTLRVRVPYTIVR